MWSWCQNIYSIEYLKIYLNGLTFRILRGYSTISSFDYATSYNVDNHIGWRPCFEVL